MLAPALLLAPVEAPIRLHLDGAPPQEADAFYHAAGVWSAADSSTIAALYFDPLTRAGRAIQARAENGVRAWGRSYDFGGALRDLAIRKSLSRQTIATWAARVSDALLAEEHDPPHTDPRVENAGRLIREWPDGRLNLSLLGQNCETSGVHLRHMFRDQVGMTMSRYQMWHRILVMVGAACSASVSSGRIRTEQTLHAAGFYDMPHGNRALRRFFGMTAADALSSLIVFIDCRNSVQPD
ncbi:MAG: helix-turn-helix transcriptional regulator [Proteobacteria bacterium]|nr:helix-turn-helix transcriptional regulator [Pseudomonadota bacterium]